VQPIVPDATAVAAVAPVPDLDVRPHPEVDLAVSGRVRPPSATARAGVASARVATVTAAPSAPLAPAPVSPARVRPAESSSGAFDAVPAAPDSRRAELRTRMRAKRRLRVISLVSLSVVVLALLPLFFGVRAAGHDPVYTSIDALGVPGWAAQKVQDKSSGSRWCFLDCPLRERTAQSQQAVAPTGKVYATALERAGWLPWKVSGCPDQPIDPKDGVYSCWKRDEFTLDLWVKRPDCAVDQVALSDPAVIPSDGIPKIPAGRCTGSAVSIKVQNAIADTRGQPDGEKPGLVGETPDPVLTDDPLLPTPSPS
jgi:integrin beta 3